MTDHSAQHNNFHNSLLHCSSEPWPKKSPLKMAFSTMRAGWTDQSRAIYWNMKVSPGEPYPPASSNVHHIFVPTKEDVKQNICSIIGHLPLQGQNVLVQSWAPKKIGKTIVLTTICQPFGIFGVNEELELYRKGCLDHKLYVHPEQGVAVGLPGRVFLKCTPEQTQNMHNYPSDQRPPCEDDAIFSRIWVSFAMPVIVDGQCVLVLEFVMDIPMVSCDTIISELCRLLEHAGFQSSIETNGPRDCININSRKRMRRTKSLPHTYYSRLVPHFGQSSADAAEKLGLKKGTFRNACRNVGIPEWPGIPSTNTRASSSPEQTRVSQTISETSSYGSSVDDSISSRFESNSEMEITPTPIAFVSENQMNQTVPEPSPNADDINYWWDEGVSEWPLELIMPVNAYALEAQINQKAADTNYIEALLEPERAVIEYQGNETMDIEDLDHHMFLDSLYHIFEDAPMMI